MVFLFSLTRTAAAGPCPNGEQLAFPTAEGFGRCAKGGRGGRVIQVTNLNASGAGSFRACLEALGPRTCIFRVGGIIDWPLESPTINPYLTIAGQTAPGDGIMIKGLQLQMGNTHDIVVRHLRVRPGDNVPVPASWGSIELYNSHDIIIDHCSAGWATDDTTGGGHSNNLTYQWCIISEGLGLVDPSKALLWSADAPAHSMSLLHSLITNYNYRVPSIASGSFQMVNNVIYNTHLGSQVYPVKSAINAEFVKNYYQRGPHSHPTVGTAITALGCGYDGFVNCTFAANSKIYLKGNYHNILRPNDTLSETALLFQSGDQTIPVVTTPLGFPVVPSETTAQQARTDVLAKAGATIPRRDSIDTRAVNDVKNGTGRMINRVSEVGGYPTYTSGTPYPDADADGISDTWETSHGLNPNSASDGPATAANGYTNLENFINELAGDPILVGVAGPVVTLAASPAKIIPGQSSTLTWSSTNATSCTASAVPSAADWSGIKGLSGTQSASPTLTTTYTLSCTGTGGTAIKSATVTVSGTLPTSIAINSGGPQFTTADGTTYLADQYFTGGSTFSTTDPIGNTTDDALYQSERFGTFSYNIPLVNGSYDVTLKFAEIFHTTPESRVFGVTIEGQPVLTNLDLFATAGHDSAKDFTFPMKLSDGVFTISFIPSVNNAKVSAIKVVPAMTTPSILRADLNQDNTVNSLDWSIMNSHWGTAGSSTGLNADLNRDGLVNSLDFSLLNGEWGKTTL